MFNSHVAQDFSALRAARGGIDLGPDKACDRDSRLPDTAGPGVNQHLVLGRHSGQIAQAVPSGAVTRCRRSGLAGFQAGWQGGDQPGVAGDKGAPAAVGVAGEATHPIADL